MKRVILTTGAVWCLVVMAVTAFAQTRQETPFVSYSFLYAPTRATDTIMDIDVSGLAPLMGGYAVWSIHAIKSKTDSALYRDGSGGAVKLVDSLQITVFGARADTGRSGIEGPDSMGYRATGYWWDSLFSWNSADTSLSTVWPKRKTVGDSTYGAIVAYSWDYERVRVRVRWGIDDDGGGAHAFTYDTDSSFYQRPRYYIEVNGMRR